MLVAHDGARWLNETLDALEGQTHPALDVVAVDNGSGDDSRRRLIDRLGTDRVLLAERDIGFGGAVAMALRTPVARRATYVLLLHDDCAPDPDATASLVAHLEANPRVAIAGAKKVGWDDPERLEAVGRAVDVTGRAHSGLEPDERDQGQHDRVRRAQYVSTCGMLVRRDVLEQLGGIDRRYHLFRDDLDLCWRAWLAGHEVEVVPAARVRHAASATNYGRLGQTAFLGPRYFAERNTLATLLKNYGGLRLLVVIPLYFVVGVLKVLGFLLTRRLGDAWQTVRAWAWNGLHLRETWRMRRRVQAQRRVGDAELRPLFARIVPRAQAYLEAVVDLATGGDYDVETVPSEPPDEREPGTVTEQLGDAFRRHPVAIVAGVLGLFGLVVALPLLAPGALRGGELLPWPSGPGAFLGDYAAAWHDAAAVGTSAAPSPAQALLGLWDLATISSDWLAPRLLVLGALPAAWLLALRAGRVVTGQRLPRLAAATAYVLSPPAVAAVRTGRVGALVVVVAVPALVIAGERMLAPDAPAGTAWRATAAAALVAAVTIAFAPPAVVALAVAAVAAAAVAVVRGRDALPRLAVATGGALLLLMPWTLRLLEPGGEILADTGAAALTDPFWRWLLLVPDAAGFPGVVAGVGLATAGVLALALAFRRRAVPVAALWAVAFCGVFGGWALGRAGGAAPAWPGLALIVAAAGLAGLLALALTTASEVLRGHDFGWRQVAGAATAATVVAGLLWSALSFVGDGWSAYAVGEPPMPAFVTAEAAGGETFRVLVLADRGGTTSWDVIPGEGPTMAGYGVVASGALEQELSRTVRRMAGDVDPGAASRLALLGIRYVVVPPGGVTDALTGSLAGQLHLEPQPVTDGRVYRVRGWLPAPAWLPAAAVEALAGRVELPPDLRVVPLERASGEAAFAGEVPAAGSVVVPQVDGRWRAQAGDRQLERSSLGPVVRFDVDGAGAVTLDHGGETRRRVAVGLQLVVFLLVVSLALRPPGFVREDAPGDDRAPLTAGGTPAGAPGVGGG